MHLQMQPVKVVMRREKYSIRLHSEALQPFIVQLAGNFEFLVAVRDCVGFGNKMAMLPKLQPR